MLDLNDVRWGELTHAYGSAIDTPPFLRMLETNPNQPDDSTDDNPWLNLWISICHQGTPYSASYAAVPHLVRIAALAADPLPVGYLILPACIVRGRVYDAYPAPMPPDLEESYLEAVAKLPSLIPRIMRPDLDETTALVITEALLILCGHWELGEGIERLTLNDIKRYWEFYHDFQHLSDVQAWNEFSDADVPISEEKPVALTLNISADMETLLRLKAAQGNQDITAYVLKLLTNNINVDLSEYDGLDDYASAVAGVQAGLEDLKAGRTYSAEEVSAMLEIDKAEWRERQAVRE